MLDRASYEHESVLKEYKQAIQKYRQYYQHEEIQGATRNIVSQIPEKAFREASNSQCLSLSSLEH